MPGDTSLALPAMNPHHHTVPKRYEETRPVQIQGFAHTKIIGLGHDLHQKALEKAENEKLTAVRIAEQAVREEAEQLKAIALAKAQEDAAIEQEKVIKKLKKAQEKALKEEALRVEMEMTKLAIEQVKQERAEGEARLRSAVVKTEETCYQQRLAAVAEARKEEQKIAADEASKIARANKQKFDNAMAQAAADKQQSLRDLQLEKDLEKAKAVQDAEARERRIAREKSESLSGQFNAVISDLRNEIENNKIEIQRLNDKIAEKERNIDTLEACLLDTRKDFQDFIDSLPPYDKRQADFLIPRIYLDELENKGYNIQPLRAPLKKKGKK